MKKNLLQVTQRGSSLFLLCCAVAFAQQPKTHTVMVKADGSFGPKWTYIHDGDTVKWQFSARSDAIIPANPIDSLTVSCSAYKPYDPTNPNEFTGPMPAAASGIFTLGPDGPGFVIDTLGASNPSCNPNNAVARVGNLYLCETGRQYATMNWTWQNPNLTGVFIRLRWDETNPAPGVYDWTAMDREIEKAVRSGKMYSLSFKAGSRGTPRWIFDPAIAGANVVERLTFQDGDEDNLQPGDCGAVADLGSPADPNYRKLYFDLWKAAAQRIRERNAWYRALAYVKPSGANWNTHENKLPRHCEQGCPICNPQVWAERGGYTPAALYSFYSEQTALLASEFPDKSMSYMLIQAGFPRVNNNGEYKEPLTMPLPAPTEQTEKILDGGRRQYGLRFVVQHNGLGVKPQDRRPPEPPCPNEGKHPAVPPFGEVGSGCPNRWVLLEGAAGQVTGFQTQNARGVATPVGLESTFQNAWDNSDAIFVEIYEQLFWAVEVAGPVLDPNATGRTTGEWAEAFHRRRRDFWAGKIPDPFPRTHSHVFKRTINSQTDNQLFYYINPSRCDAGNTASFGAIVILPDNVTSVENEEAGRTPGAFALRQNYPNPFNPATTISYSTARPGQVELKIYDSLGKLIRTMVQEYRAAGAYSVVWDGKNDAGRQMASGGYFYELSIGEFRSTRKMILLQ
ncbi:MAG: FlgD immunoglobulin-like domain containing protein [bacterium]